MLLAVDDRSRVAEVRSAATQLAKSAGLSEEAVGQIAIVATELATNILKHAGRGELSLGLFSDHDGSGVELLALDRGPGMPDVQKALSDGFSTAGSPGTGLGAVQRQSDVFGLYSRPGLGTAILARKRNDTEPFEHFLIGAVAIPCPGETVSGDAWSALQKHETAALLVADGSGHGSHAAEAAKTAVAIFNERNSVELERLIDAMHHALRPTRGASIAVAQLEPASGIARYCGIGNISGTIITEGESRKLVSYNGVAGHGSPKIRSFQYPFSRPSMIILHSDGLTARWDLSAYPGLSGAHPAIIAGVLARDHRRGRDDATVVVVRAGSS